MAVAVNAWVDCLQAEAALAAVQNSTDADQGALKAAKQSAKKAQAEASHLQQELKQAKDSEAEAAKLRKSLAKAQEKLAAVNAEVCAAPAKVVLRTAASLPCVWCVWSPDMCSHGRFR